MNSRVSLSSHHFANCASNEGFETSLDARRLYQVDEGYANLHQSCET